MKFFKYIFNVSILSAWMCLIVCGLVLLFSYLAPAQTGIAPSPPMGWNSWDAYGTTVTEQEVKANADYMAKNLKKFGWQYIVVDIQWYEPNAKAGGYRADAELVLDGNGRLLPAVNRFPSAAGGKGFKPLADYIHKLGLKFGIHIMRGIPRQAVRANLPVLGTNTKAAEIADQNNVCKWNTDMFGIDTSKPGGQEYYNSIVKLYADWGVDYIKADDMSAPVFQENEIAALQTAIRKSGRPIILSLSPGPAPVEQITKLRRNANLWRISDDFWDRWPDLKKQFEYARKWQNLTGPNAWADADMLPLGRIGIRAERGKDRPTRFTKDEQITLMSLWLIFRSPLMFGGDLPGNDAWTNSLITNKEALAVNKNSFNNRELFNRGDKIAWVADIPKSKEKYVALFNTNDSGPEEIKIGCLEIGLKTANCKVRDLWNAKNLGLFKNEFSAQINSHGAGLFLISPAR